MNRKPCDIFLAMIATNMTTIDGTPRIGVIGLGFVGLATALCFAERGYRVSGYDIDRERMGILHKGIVPFFEPGLEAALGRNKCGLTLAADIGETVRSSDVVFFCVGTPSLQDGKADLSILLDAISMAMRAVPGNGFRMFVVKSTVPPGSTAGPIAHHLESLGALVEKNVGLAVNPEFLREGFAWEDSMNPDRIVIGACDARSETAMLALYQQFGAPVRLLSPTGAEFVKYASNTLLATMISYSNEMALLADRLGGIDVPDAFSVLHEDRRWRGNPASMTAYVYPGCGFGGYCLPKDTAAIVAMQKENGLPEGLLAASLRINAFVGEEMAKRISAATSCLKQPIGILGLSFKPGSNDVRCTPSAVVVEKLLSLGHTNIVAHDPLAQAEYAKAFSHAITFARTADALLSSVDVVGLCTAWPEYKTLDYSGKRVIDGRYVL